jgi:hypothetical protein
MSSQMVGEVIVVLHKVSVWLMDVGDDELEGSFIGKF